MERAEATRHMRRPIERVVNYEEPVERKPPLVETGWLGWVRTHLFGSVTDSIVTLVLAYVIVSLLSGLVQWSVVQADWAAITRNLRLFAIGPYPPDQMQRVTLVGFITALLAGVSLRLTGRMPTKVALGLLGSLVVIGLLPFFTRTLPHPSVYQYISLQSEPESIGLIFGLDAGSEVTIRVYPSDARQHLPTGFLSIDSLTAAGEARREAQSRDRLTARAEAGEQVDLPESPPPPDISATARLFTGNTLEEIGVVHAAAGGEREAAETHVIIPSDGWYIIVPAFEGSYGSYWLEISSVEVITSSEVEQQALIERFGSQLPAGDAIEGVRLRLGDAGFLGFSGERTLAQYLRLHVGPLFESLRIPLSFLAVTFALGYVTGIVMRRQPWAPRIVSVAWAISFVLVVMLLRGLTATEVYNLSSVFLTLSLTLPILYGVLTSRLNAHEDEDYLKFFRAGLILLGVIVLRSLVAGSDIVFLIGALLGLLTLWYGLDATSRRRLTLWVGIPLLLTAVYSAIVRLFPGQQLGSVLPLVSTARWGGLMLTLMLAVVSIVMSFPVGVLLALGRRSQLPIIRVFCIGMIEFVRGVPLITILFMADLMVPLLSAQLATVDNVVRAMTGFTLFSAAYVAEIVRGGLQSVPYGQTEAAKALGMPAWKINAYVVLPQALRAVIPALVGQFISLFKDTSLVFIIGLVELLGVARTVFSQPEFIGTQRETLVFIGSIYFVGSYAMSAVSRRLERTGAGAARRAIL